MGKFSRKASKGKDYRNWASGADVTSGPSRQRTRAVLRSTAWLQMSHPPMQDEGGIIPRWIRRAMSLGLARKMWAAGRQGVASNQHGTAL